MQNGRVLIGKEGRRARSDSRGRSRTTKAPAGGGGAGAHEMMVPLSLTTLTNKQTDRREIRALLPSIWLTRETAKGMQFSPLRRCLLIQIN